MLIFPRPGISTIVIDHAGCGRPLHLPQRRFLGAHENVGNLRKRANANGLEADIFTYETARGAWDETTVSVVARLCSTVLSHEYVLFCVFYSRVSQPVSHSTRHVDQGGKGKSVEVARQSGEREREIHVRWQWRH